MQILTGAQRKYLRGLAHGLKPLAQVGRQGLTEAVLSSLDQTLESHELVKVRFLDFQDEKRELSEEISQRLECAKVGMIGHVAIFFRPAADPDARRIVLPKPRSAEDGSS